MPGLGYRVIQLLTLIDGARGDAGQALLWAAAGAILLGALLLRRRGARRAGERHRPAAG